MSEQIQSRLGSTDKYDLAWSWDSLDADLLGTLGETLVDWVLDYNENFVVKPQQIIPKCWPVHRGLAREIAAIYAHWMRTFHHPEATPSDATYFYDRVLTDFQMRVPGWLGPHPERCQAGEHDREWDKDVADRITAVAAGRGETIRRLSETYAPQLAETRSAPEAADPDGEPADVVVFEDSD